MKYGALGSAHRPHNTVFLHCRYLLLRRCLNGRVLYVHWGQQPFVTKEQNLVKIRSKRSADGLYTDSSLAKLVILITDG